LTTIILTIERQIETDGDKVRNLIHREISSVDQQKFSIKIEDGRLIVEVPEEAFFLEGLQVVKRTLTAEVEKFLPKYATVIFVETFKKPTEAKPTTETKPTTEVTASTS
jgi:hypothetical protein